MTDILLIKVEFLATFDELMFLRREGQLPSPHLQIHNHYHIKEA